MEREDWGNRMKRDKEGKRVVWLIIGRPGREILPANTLSDYKARGLSSSGVGMEYYS